MIKHRIAGILYRNILKKIFFKKDPEDVHDRMLENGHFLGKYRITRFITRKLFDYQNPILSQEISGLKFRNPVCLSAGFDKNASIVDILPEVGFGAMELGSVTWKPYEGNPKPRLYRLPKSKALVVYYGLMNVGVVKFVEKLKKYVQKKSIVGISVAKTNCTDTSTEEGGINDYFECLKYLEHEQIGDFYTINISCPNTFGGEPYTTGEKLEKLLKKISELNIKKPVFVKMPINLPLEEFDSLLKVIIKYKLTGVVIGNLTKVRDPELIKDEIPEHIKGGISGMPTQKLNNELISYTYKNYGKDLVIVGVGGIFSPEDAYEKIKRGASFVQLITGMIFQGPQLIGEINYGLTKLLKKDGYSNIKEAIGRAP
jgi:dihydroorotate dehydrogenase